MRAPSCERSNFDANVLCLNKSILGAGVFWGAVAMVIAAVRINGEDSARARSELTPAGW
jgi:hypothetical protein